MSNTASGSFRQIVSHANIHSAEKLKKHIVNPLWVLFLLFLGTIFDPGGGFYVKQAVFLIAVIYLLTQSLSYFIWLRCLPDLAIVILIPSFITMAQMIFSAGLGFEGVFDEMWRRLGSPAYFIFLPLIYFVGTERTSKWLVVFLTSVALASILITFAHAIGFINIFDYTAFMMDHRLATFGTDTRAGDIGITNFGVTNFGPSQAFPLAFTFALIYYPVNAIILASSAIIGGSRGQLLGILLSSVLMLLLLRACRLGLQRKGYKISKKFIKGLALAVLFIGGFGAVISLLMPDLVSLMLYKYELLASFKDESSFIKLGHFAGYWQVISEAPLGIFWGVGPDTLIYNPVSGRQIFMTEIVILIYMIWYGWIYSIIFVAWIIFGLWRLLRQSCARFDVALVVAVIILLIIGNINPLMQTPLAFILLALARVRRLELGEARK